MRHPNTFSDAPQCSEKVSGCSDGQRKSSGSELPQANETLSPLHYLRTLRPKPTEQIAAPLPLGKVLTSDQVISKEKMIERSVFCGQV